MKFFRHCGFIGLFIIGLTRINAQNTPQEEASRLFDEKQYAEALPIFKRLVTLFPKDPRYQYYSGACMVMSNNELKKAIDYLAFAADKAVPRDVYFFLGKAYLYQYKFSDALSAFLKFQQFGERAEKERWQCDMHIAMARNGQSLMGKECRISIYKTDTIFRKDVFSFYNRLLSNGKFKEIQDRSFVFSESKDRTAWRFEPVMLSKNESVYGSSSSGLRKNKDIVLYRKISENGWSRAENLGSMINSPYDEDFAYFNVAESTLYFSSQGHNSMGGYDIFKSVYHPDTKTWSEPENLGYPINTPYDDFLFVPSEDQTKALMVSSRASHDDKVVVYTISFTKNFSYTDLSPALDYNARSNFKSLSKYPVTSAKKDNPKDPVATLPVEQKKYTSPKNYPEELLHQNDYNDQLNKAMGYQLQSDSLGRLAEDLRQKVYASKKDSEKDQLKKEIFALESKSKGFQQKADECYEKARLYETQYMSRGGNNGSRVSDDKVKKAFRKGDSTATNSSVPDKKPSKVPAKIQATTSVPTILYDFKVMAKSPYTSVSQIPVNQKLPMGLLYRIQLGAFSKVIEPDRFKGITPITGDVLQNGAVTKYYAGYFNRFLDAEKAVNRVKELGFSDAYLVSFFDGKPIPVNRAREIENDK